MSEPPPVALTTRRFDVWREIVADAFLPLDCRRRSRGEPFSAAITTWRLGPLRLSRVVSNEQRVARSPALIAATPHDDLLVNVQRVGRSLVAQSGRHAALAPGALALYDTARPYVLEFDGPFEQLVWQFPRRLLLDRAPALEHGTAVAVDGSAGSAAVLRAALDAVARSADAIDPAERDAIADTLLSLLATALARAAGLPVSGGAADTAAAAGHAARARAFIDRHAADPALSPSALAAGVGVSLRQLERALSHEGTTPAAAIRDARLERARAALTDPRRAHLTVTDIALRCGFASPAHFARAFRRRYGMAPSAARGDPVERSG